VQEQREEWLAHIRCINDSRITNSVTKYKPHKRRWLARLLKETQKLMKEII
jgi:hypothetical protein